MEATEINCEMGTHHHHHHLFMWNNAGKLFEKLLQPMLAAAIETFGGLSERQCSLRPSRSTLGAIADVVECVERISFRHYYPKRIVVLASFAVRIAFNRLRWEDIIKALRETFCIPIYFLRILRSYLKDRKIFYDTLDRR